MVLYLKMHVHGSAVLRPGKAALGLFAPVFCYVKACHSSSVGSDIGAKTVIGFFHHRSNLVWIENIECKPRFLLN